LQIFRVTVIVILIFSTEDYAISFNNECLKKGLILRHVNSFGIPNGIRINSGTDDETAFAIDVIKQVQKLLVSEINLQHN